MFSCFYILLNQFLLIDKNSIKFPKIKLDLKI